MTEKIGRLFVELTKFQNLEVTGQMKGTAPPLLELPYDKQKKVIDLPDPQKIKGYDIDLRDAIEKRESRRGYARNPLALEELSFLLWSTQGVKQVTGGATLRTVPSAGARHALETYLLVNNVKDLDPGLYRFLAIEHGLINLSKDPGLSRKITHACLGQDIVSTSAVTFIWAAVPYRMNWRYGERGYRYVHLDAGHACQNLYLSAEAIQSGVCAIGAFSDDEMNSVLGIDGEEQFVMYLATVGKV